MKATDTCLVCEQPLIVVTDIRVHPTCDMDPQIAVGDVFATIRHGMIYTPRSGQRMIGPSEIGQPCERRIGYRLAQVPKTRVEDAAWMPFIGTSVHEQLADIVARTELARWNPDGSNDPAPRWHVEERVTVGTVAGIDITGSCDLFDAQYGIVYDHKVVSKNKIRETYRPHGPGEQYRLQAHLYGKGFEDAGHDVRHVAIIFWTRDGQFEDRHVWTEPYDRQIAIDALARLERINTLLTELGPQDALPLLEATESYCTYCPWFHRGANDPAKSCAGVEREIAPRVPFASLS